jgi:hypothetical protein
MTKPSHLATIVVSLAVGLLLAMAVPATASADEIDPQVAYALAHVPGGHAVSATEAVWPSLGMDLLVASNSSHAMSGNAILTVGGCPTGEVCAFSGGNTLGTRLSWSSCGTFSTSALNVVGSIADARSTGSLQALNGSTVVAGAAAGTYANTPNTVTAVRCNTAQ